MEADCAWLHAHGCTIPIKRTAEDFSTVNDILDEVKFEHRHDEEEKKKIFYPAVKYTEDSFTTPAKLSVRFHPTWKVSRFYHRPSCYFSLGPVAFRVGIYRQFSRNDISRCRAAKRQRRGWIRRTGGRERKSSAFVRKLSTPKLFSVVSSALQRPVNASEEHAMKKNRRLINS